MAAEDKATDEDARRCLQHLKSELRKLPLEQRRNVCEQLGAGGLVLHWLWKRKDVKYDNIYGGVEGSEFAGLHIWFLLGEGLEEFIWDWMSIVSNDAVKKVGRGKPNIAYKQWYWTLHVMAALVRAHVMWAPGNLPNAALRAYQRAHSTFPPSGPHFRGVALIGMRTKLEKTLNRDTCPPCDPELFDWYTNSRVAETHGDPERRAMENSYLPLYHPVDPNAQPLLELFRRAHAKERLDDFMLTRTKAMTRNSVASRMLRAAYILRLESDSTAADLLESAVAARCEPVWRAREKVWASSNADIKLDGKRARKSR